MESVPENKYRTSTTCPLDSSPSSHKIHSETDKALDERRQGIQGGNIGNETRSTEKESGLDNRWKKFNMKEVHKQKHQGEEQKIRKSVNENWAYR